MGDKNHTLSLVLDIIVLIVFVGLTILAFNIQSLLMIAELAVLFVLLFIALIALVAVYYKIRFGSVLLTLIFALSLFNLLLIYLRKGSMRSSLFFLTIVIALIGFLISVASIKKKEEAFEEPAEKSEPVTETYTPGKFVGSKTGSSYHIPKCDWAKKIRENKREWFDSEEEAKKKGFKPHSCIEEIS